VDQNLGESLKNRFETRTTGKWILAGEHSVLRGFPALVFPLKSKSLRMVFEPQSSGLELAMGEGFGPEFRVLFWSLLEKACTLADFSIQKISGRIYFESDIPVGSGLGASASLCVAVTHWFRTSGLISQEQEPAFARNLENIFHGESSGVDVAVVLSEQGLHYERNGISTPLKPNWEPIWGLTDTGQKGMTYDCVRQVKDLHQSAPELGIQLDQQMGEAVRLCESGLLASQRDGFERLASGINLAGNCFEQWGLVTQRAQDLMSEIREAGAVAVKPTGSGGGGFILSLWPAPWPESMSAKIIACPV
jgi:mevalonate kinase